MALVEGKCEETMIELLTRESIVNEKKTKFRYFMCKIETYCRWLVRWLMWMTANVTTIYDIIDSLMTVYHNDRDY